MSKVKDFLGTQATEFFNQKIAYHPISTLPTTYNAVQHCQTKKNVQNKKLPSGP
jgi:hypothetical protein